jgi:hypothetical protein
VRWPGGCHAGWRRGDTLTVEHGKLDHHHAVTNHGWKRFDAGIFPWAICYLVAFEVDFPSVQRANNGSAGDDAVGQGPTAVRTFIFDGEKTIAEIEDGDVMAGDGDGAAFAERNIFSLRNAYPLFGMRGCLIHWSTLSIGSI